MNSTASYTVGPVESDGDLRAIAEIQLRNQREGRSEADLRDHGFVSLRHSLELLREMSGRWPHTVARCDGAVVGYALVTLPEFGARIPDLDPFFARLDAMSMGGFPLARVRYFVMGQVCVDRGHRGQRLVDRMYAAQAEQMRGAFDWSITEVNAENTRSLRVHERTGWTEFDRYADPEGRTWVVLGLRLRAPQPPAREASAVI